MKSLIHNHFFLKFHYSVSFSSDRLPFKISKVRVETKQMIIDKVSPWGTSPKG